MKNIKLKDDQENTLCLGIESGGTGANNITQAKENLGIYNNTLRGKKCLLIGDSFSFGTGSSTNIADSKGWAYYFQLTSQCIATTIFQNGGGFQAVGNVNANYPEYTFAECIEAKAEEIGAEGCKEFEYIVAQTGLNDVSTSRNPQPTNLPTYVTQFITACRENFPNAQITVVVTWNANTMTSSQYSYLGYSIGAQCANLGVRCITESLNWFYGRSDWMYTDNAHLNSTGYRLLGNRILAAISGWDGKIIYQTLSSTITMNTNITSDNLSAVIDGFNVHLHGRIRYNGTAFKDEQEVANYTLFTLPGPLRPGETKYIPGGMIYNSPTSAEPNTSFKQVAIIRVHPDGRVGLRKLAPEQHLPLENLDLYIDVSFIRQVC